MQASIYQPTKTAMQSGLKNVKYWLLEFKHDSSREIEPIMGWTSSKDMLHEVRMKFPNKESAINFAESNNINYEIIEPRQKKLIKKSYADNFK
jgi:hypothetical protein